MKRIAIIITIVIGTLVATAMPAGAVASMHSKRDLANYQKYVRHELGYAPSQKQLDGLGDSICKLFRLGGDVEDIIDAGIDAGLSDDEISVTTVGAVTFLCPDEAHELAEFSDRVDGGYTY